MAKMLGNFLWIAAILCSQVGLVQGPAFSQMPVGERVDADVALDRALKRSSLTFEGKPFHAVMEIGEAGSTYSGRIEVWWVNAQRYHLSVSSPKFSQQKTVKGNLIEEKNDGDYYPRWLEDFVLALINPLPMEKNFRGRGGVVLLAPQVTRSCLRRDDRPGGITDQLTWGEVCFSGSEPYLGDVLTFNHSMTYEDWKGFGTKQIARRYQTDVLDYKPVVGRLTELEELKKPDEAMFSVTSPTPMGQEIGTKLVSTLTEESMVEHAPVIEWPPVREGRTEGYMIVYARTDRTGQVRETEKHNSDQPGLESFGMVEALKFKFKPLMVNGVAQQMEMPLVLHFTSRMGDPIPTLNVEQMRRQMNGCELGRLPAGTPTVVVRVAVDATGKVAGYGPVGATRGSEWVFAISNIGGCKITPYAPDGKPVYFKGDVELTAP